MVLVVSACYILCISWVKKCLDKDMFIQHKSTKCTFSKLTF